jgi:hypothetical protein
MIMKTTPTLSMTSASAGPGDHSPTAVLILPFEPTMTPKGELEASLKASLGLAERQLMAVYPCDTALPVIQQLQQMVRDLNFTTHKKSVVLLASASTAKTLYLDIPVDRQVLVDSDFHIKDLATTRDKNVPFLILLLSGRLSKMFHCDGNRMTLIKNNAFRPVYAYMRQLPEQVANVSDPSAMKEQLLDKFLRHMDDGLGYILDAWPLPVFVIGTEKVIGHFAAITRHARQVAAYIHKNCIRSTETELTEILQPYLDDWHMVRQQMVRKNLELARDLGKLTTGLDAVGKIVCAHNSRLLVVENGFTGNDAGNTPGSSSAPFYLADPVDGIIEKVLGNGGRVEWVDEGQLEAMGHIALVRYY